MTDSLLPPVTDEGAAPPADAARGAFRELHGHRLHGFALLLTIGDRAQAASLAADALAEAAGRIGELRHPERAAAWLRERVVRHAHRLPRARRRGAALAAARGELLGDLGADEAVVAGLAVLDRLERAALIGSDVERFDRRDVATIVGRDGAGLDRLLRRARTRYVGAHAAAAGPDAPPAGPIVTHITELARRAMS